MTTLFCLYYRIPQPSNIPPFTVTVLLFITSATGLLTYFDTIVFYVPLCDNFSYFLYLYSSITMQNLNDTSDYSVLIAIIESHESLATGREKMLGEHATDLCDRVHTRI